MLGYSHFNVISLHSIIKGTSNNSKFVTPVKTGVQSYQGLLDSGFRRNDIFRGGLKFNPRTIGSLILNNIIFEGYLCQTYSGWEDLFDN